MRLSNALLMVALIPAVTAAQQFLPNLGPPVDPNTRFEVASVKAGEPGGPVMMRTTAGRFESTNMPLGIILRQALQKQDFEIVGTPGWVDTERYSITAKVPDGVPPSATSAMLLNLLKDRFQFATHLETRELPIFHLVTARGDGRLGPEIRATPAECQATIAERLAAAKAAAGRGGPPPLPPLGDPNGPPPCGLVRQNLGLLAGSGRTMADLAPVLSDWMGRPVLDKTGLTGMYDFTLRYAADSARSPGIFRLLSPAQPAAAVDPDAPSLVVALQEQLGLKLEGARGPVQVVVIEKIERPELD